MWKSCFALRVFLLDLLMFLHAVAAAKGPLQCACTTFDCLTEGAVRCFASSMCYVQYLDRGDGTSPWSRGCIDGTANSLLCENQPPAAAAGKGAWRKGGKRRKGSAAAAAADDAAQQQPPPPPPLLWPLIHCCATSFCNSEEFSASYPVWMKKKLRAANETWAPGFPRGESPPMKNSFDPTDLANNNNNNDDADADVGSYPPSGSSSSSSSNSVDYDAGGGGGGGPYSYYHPKVLTFASSTALNPIYVVVPAIGAAILVVIVIFACFLLRKHAAGSSSSSSTTARSGVGGAGHHHRHHHHHHHGAGPASTPSLLSSAPFLFVDHQEAHGRNDPASDFCAETSSSSSSSLYCNHLHHHHQQQHHQQQQQRQKNSLAHHYPHQQHLHHQLHLHPQQPPKYEEAFLNPASDIASHNNNNHPPPPPPPPLLYHPHFDECSPAKTSHGSAPTLSSTLSPTSTAPLPLPPSFLSASPPHLRVDDDVPPSYDGTSYGLSGTSYGLSGTSYGLSGTSYDGPHTLIVTTDEGKSPLL